MAAPAPMLAQQAASKPAVELKMSVLEGQNARNNITTKAGSPIAVQVTDVSGKPVPGAEVVFQLPSSGPGGAFSGWILTYTTKTNEQGRAAASAFEPNDVAGPFKVEISANLNGGAAKTEVAQSNFVDNTVKVQDVSAKRSWWKWAAVVGGIGAVIGILAATR